MAQIIKTDKELKEESYMQITYLLQSVLNISTLLDVNIEPLLIESLNAIRKHNQEVKNNLKKINNQNRLDLQ